MTAVRLVRVALQLYKKRVSPLLWPACRFYPSCADYAAEAIGHYGLLRGAARAARRLARCHPWHPGGHDPVTGADRGPTETS
jgi:putative membrane protein insertion efficiency factor